MYIHRWTQQWRDQCPQHQQYRQKKFLDAGSCTDTERKRGKVTICHIKENKQTYFYKQIDSRNFLSSHRKQSFSQNVLIREFSVTKQEPRIKTFWEKGCFRAMTKNVPQIHSLIIYTGQCKTNLYCLEHIFSNCGKTFMFIILESVPFQLCGAPGWCERSPWSLPWFALAWQPTHKQNITDSDSDTAHQQATPWLKTITSQGSAYRKCG